MYTSLKLVNHNTYVSFKHLNLSLKCSLPVFKKHLEIDCDNKPLLTHMFRLSCLNTFFSMSVLDEKLETIYRSRAFWVNSVFSCVKVLFCCCFVRDFCPEDRFPPPFMSIFIWLWSWSLNASKLLSHSTIPCFLTSLSLLSTYFYSD